MSLGPIPMEVKAIMYEICEGLCEYCGSSDLDISPHHKPYRSQPGAANDIEHLVWLCRNCHKMAHHQHGGIPHGTYYHFRDWYDNLNIKELRGCSNQLEIE